MGLVSPLFLVAGALLALAPIIIHILNRRRFKRVQWAAMEFLLRAVRKNRRRLRFEQMLLLATRCAVLLLAGLALSRPMGCQSGTLANVAGRRAGLHVIVINNSYSMSAKADRPDEPGGQTQLDQAKRIAIGIIDRLYIGGESVAVITASRPARAVLLTPTYDLNAAKAAIQRIPQTARGTDELGALILARDIARSTGDVTTKNLYLIDDAKRAAWQADSDGLARTAAELAGLYRGGISHFNLSLPGVWNEAVVDVASSQRLVTDRFGADFVADVRGYGPVPADAKMTWKVDDQAVAYAGGIRATPQPTPVAFTASNLVGGIHVVEADIASDDRFPIDDVRRRVVDVVSQMRLLIVEGERGLGGLGSSGAFLDTALNPTAAAEAGSNRKPASYIATERISDLELGNKILSDYRCVCLCGVGQIQETQAAALEKFVRAGGTLMLFMGDPVTAENYNTTLYKHGLLPGPLAKRITVSGDQPPRRFAFDPKGVLHPILADFAGHENTGMESAEIYAYWQVDLAKDSKAERVLDFLPAPGASDRAPDPAITVHSLGAGRVLFYATSADPNSEWTTFMAHQAYPALMHMLVLGTVSSGDDWLTLVVGQSLTIPSRVKLLDTPHLRDAAQADVALQQATDADGQTIVRSAELENPGIYQLSTGALTLKVAVNVPADEADVTPIADSALKKAMGEIDIQLNGDSLPPEDLNKQTGNDFGWSVMAIVLLCIGLESLMAMRFGHYRR